MDKFFESFEKEMKIGYTENKGRGHKTTNNPIVDFSFRIPSYRNSKDGMFLDFYNALKFDSEYAIKMLFHMRDIRQGMGERDSFRQILVQLSPYLTPHLVKLIPEYGRWDDIFVLKGTPAEQIMLGVIREQLWEDIRNMLNQEPVSLLGKWLPSIQSRNKEKRNFAKLISRSSGIGNYEKYAQTTKRLRSYLNVVEIQMSKNRWEHIDYELVPSMANKVYNRAFLRHDEARRTKFINDALAGKKKINAGAIFPHDLVKMVRGSGSVKLAEAQWKNLPNFMEHSGRTMVVCDTSASMGVRVGGSQTTTASDVAIGLSIYTSERLPEPYKDKVITFSHSPTYMDLSGYTSLRGKVSHIINNRIVEDTNIEAVFNLILATAVENNLTQEEMIDNVLVISDMEFNSCQVGTRWGETLFDTIERRYRENGYELPNLVFWNVNSRTNIIPKIDKGVKLLSGFSPAVLKQLSSLGSTPWESLKELLDSPRYQEVTFNKVDIV